MGGARGTLAVLGIAGVLYGIITTVRARRAMVYQPVLEDWMWHSILPTLAYTAVAIAGCLLGLDASTGMFAIGGATVLLLFVGIHNAWDTATYVTLSAAARRERVSAGASAPPSPPTSELLP